MRFTLALLTWIAGTIVAGAQLASPPTAQRPAVAAPAPVSPAPVAKPSHVGQWLTEGGKSRVEVSECAPAICAKIVWLKEPNDEKGQPLRDGYNKSTAMRTRPILGLPLFENMKVAKTGWAGRIYNPEEGEWYDVTVWMPGPDKISIKGCVLFVCETHHWNRAAAAATTAAPAPAAPPSKRTQ
jgi:uncharacterized protein (DUF2147 family)